jgi:hypothetical protein
MITELTDVHAPIMHNFLEEIIEDVELSDKQVEKLQQIMYNRNLKFYFYKNTDNETRVGYDD